jgi:hypothetical protein
MAGANTTVPRILLRIFDARTGYRVQGHEESDDKRALLREVVQRCVASLGITRGCKILQLCKIFQVFAKMDTDNDGRIKLHDFTQVMLRSRASRVFFTKLTKN